MREWDSPADVRNWHLGRGWDGRTLLVVLTIAFVALAVTGLAVMASDARVSRGLGVPAPLAAGPRTASAAAPPAPVNASSAASALGVPGASGGSTASTVLTTSAPAAATAAISGAPQAGAIFACVTRFTGGGAQATGPWIGPDGTVDLAAKPAVAGAVTWPARFSITMEGSTRRFTGNGLPAHATGIFPIQATDPAFQFDRNPNAIREVPVALAVPAVPTPAPQAGCLPMGPIGVLLSGATVFNALDAVGRDAVAYEIQDRCAGHPAPMGAYHYHSLSPCVLESLGGAQDPEVHSPLAGYALDGFGLYGPRGERGQELTTGALDECHGHTHEVEWDGKRMELYHYHATWTYPYTLGCFRAAPAAAPR